jgi:L-malate glycosyltransferase
VQQSERPFGVLVVSPRFSPIVGGGENQARLVADELIARGHEVLVVASRKRGFARYERVGRIHVRRLPSFQFRREVGIYGVLENLLFVVSLVLVTIPSIRRFDIVLFFWGLDFFALPALVYRLFRRKTMIRTASVFSREFGNLRSAKLFSLRKQSWRAFDVFLAITSEIAERFRQEGIPQGRIRRMRNGVDCTKFFPLGDEARAAMRVSLGLKPDGTYVLYCGHLNAIKGIDFLLRAIARLQNIPAATELLILGSGAFATGSLEDQVREQTAGGGGKLTIRMIGQVEARQSYFQCADVLVLPSRTEGLSNVMLEAMASAVPCIATRVGGPRDVVEDGSDGLLVEYGDDEGLRRAISALANDPERRRVMGERARTKIIQGFDIHDVIRAYEALGEELLQPR